MAIVERSWLVGTKVLTTNSKPEHQSFLNFEILLGFSSSVVKYVTNVSGGRQTKQRANKLDALTHCARLTPTCARNKFCYAAWKSKHESSS